MGKQVITIAPDGSISGLQHKKGQGVDLRQMGHAKIERASHIVWLEMPQAWAVQMLTGPYAGHFLTRELWQEAVAPPLSSRAYVCPESQVLGDGLLGFEDYDAAVRAEVAALDGFRLQGKF